MIISRDSLSDASQFMQPLSLLDKVLFQLPLAVPSSTKVVVRVCLDE